MKIITNGNKTSIVAGDHNINLLNYSTNQQTIDFINDLHANSILPNDYSSYPIWDSCATLIDNFLTNKISDSHFTGIILDDISDHLPILLIGDVRF